MSGFKLRVGSSTDDCIVLDITETDTTFEVVGRREWPSGSDMDIFGTIPKGVPTEDAEAINTKEDLLVRLKGVFDLMEEL